MMSVARDEWAQTSLAVLDSANEAVETVDMAGSTLEEQLDAAEVWLRERGSVLGGAENEQFHVRLFSSWTPSDGQRAMTLPQSLVRALARVDGVFWMDVYTEND